MVMVSIDKFSLGKIRLYITTVWLLKSICLMPPRVPATRKTYFGRVALKQALMAVWSRRSNCSRVAVRNRVLSKMWG